MLDVKYIKNNLEFVNKMLKKRGAEEISPTLIEKYNKALSIRTQLEQLLAKHNEYNKLIAEKKCANENTDELIAQISSNKKLESELKEELTKYEDEYKTSLAYIPNILLEEVPEGLTEDDNVVVKVVDEPKKFNFQPKSHDELGKNLGMMDFKTAADMSGSRFVILTKDLAKLERALASFMLDVHIEQHKFTEYRLPLIVNNESAFGSSQLPKFKEDIFTIEGEDKLLIPTAEVPLVNLFRNKVIKDTDLPIRVTAHSSCFRSEAGSAGRDISGMIRLHQFEKVELVSFVEEDKGLEELDFIVSCAEKILSLLKLPYRVLKLCAGDVGFSAAITYDLEVWLPEQNKYREISSCSYCSDFQARRISTRYKDTKAGKKNKFVHTLNGSGLAVGRALIAIMENYQLEDGGIEIPDVLVPYMNNQILIKN